MKKLIFRFTIYLIAYFFYAANSYAASLSFSFSTLPSSGEIVGQAGDTIGWGYTITNQDTNDWFVATTLNSTSMQLGNPDASYFDFPIIQPGQSVSEVFDTVNYLGLYGIQLDTSVSTGQLDTGIFSLSGQWWSGDPFAGGAFIQNSVVETTPFSVLIQNPTSSVPEPSVVSMLIFGIIGIYSTRKLHLTRFSMRNSTHV